MARTKITLRPAIITVYTPSKIRKLSFSSSSSEDECNLIAVVYASISPPNVSKKTTPADISISEHFKKYSKQNSINTACVALKSSSYPHQIVRISASYHQILLIITTQKI